MPPTQTRLTTNERRTKMLEDLDAAWDKLDDAVTGAWDLYNRSDEDHTGPLYKRYNQLDDLANELANINEELE